MTDQQAAFDDMIQSGDLVPHIAPEVLEEVRQQRNRDAARRAMDPPRLPVIGLEKFPPDVYIRERSRRRRRYP
jgi:hypothetical protein